MWEITATQGGKIIATETELGLREIVKRINGARITLKTTTQIVAVRDDVDGKVYLYAERT